MRFVASLLLDNGAAASGEMKARFFETQLFIRFCQKLDGYALKCRNDGGKRVSEERYMTSSQ
jgi:hypothetical protein